MIDWLNPWFICLQLFLVVIAQRHAALEAEARTAEDKAAQERAAAAEPSAPAQKQSTEVERPIPQSSGNNNVAPAAEEDWGGGALAFRPRSKLTAFPSDWSGGSLPVALAMPPCRVPARRLKKEDEEDEVMLDVRCAEVFNLAAKLERMRSEGRASNAPTPCVYGEDAHELWPTAYSVGSDALTPCDNGEVYLVEVEAEAGGGKGGEGKGGGGEREMEALPSQVPHYTHIPARLGQESDAEDVQTLTSLIYEQVVEEASISEDEEGSNLREAGLRGSLERETDLASERVRGPVRAAQGQREAAQAMPAAPAERDDTVAGPTGMEAWKLWMSPLSLPRTEPASTVMVSVPRQEPTSPSEDEGSFACSWEEAETRSAADLDKPASKEMPFESAFPCVASSSPAATASIISLSSSGAASACTTPLKASGDTIGEANPRSCTEIGRRARRCLNPSLNPKPTHLSPPKRQHTSTGLQSRSLPPSPAAMSTVEEVDSGTEEGAATAVTVTEERGQDEAVQLMVRQDTLAAPAIETASKPAPLSPEDKRKKLQDFISAAEVSCCVQDLVRCVCSQAAVEAQALEVQEARAPASAQTQTVSGQTAPGHESKDTTPLLFLTSPRRRPNNGSKPQDWQHSSDHSEGMSTGAHGNGAAKHQHVCLGRKQHSREAEILKSQCPISFTL